MGVIVSKTTPFGGFGSAAAQQSALRNAIIGSRQAQPQQFLNYSSNYLVPLFQSGVLKAPDIRTIAPSISTQNISGRALDYFQSLINGPSGQSSAPTDSSGDVNIPPGGAPPQGSQIQSFGDFAALFKKGIESIGPTGIVLGGLLLAVVLLKK